MTDLHRATGDARFLTWAKEDLLAMVDQARDARGQAIPFVVSFRNLPPFCMAVLYLRERGLLDAEQSRRVSAQVSASVATHYPTTDFGAQNRGLIDAAGFYFAAAVVPADPDVAKWRGYGAALAADSWNAWSIEDASIYQPFWLNYTLTLSDLLGTSDAHLRAVTTRFYFDQAKALQLPNGLLPDWGDGDWTHSWAWNFANFVRAASQYRDGTYLEAARRLYTAALAYWGELRGDELYSAGLALRWLDATVPLAAFTQDQSAEVVDDLVSKKIVFRSASGAYAPDAASGATVAAAALIAGRHPTSPRRRSERRRSTSPPSPRPAASRRQLNPLVPPAPPPGGRAPPSRRGPRGAPVTPLRFAADVWRPPD
jgi:hypothetical protein